MFPSNVRWGVVRSDAGYFVGLPTGQAFLAACALARNRSLQSTREHISVYEIVDALPNWRRTYRAGKWLAASERAYDVEERKRAASQT